MDKLANNASTVNMIIMQVIGSRPNLPKDIIY